MGKQHVEMLGKQIQVDISKKAEAQLGKRAAPLHVEMELYFSCLLRKQTRIYEAEREKADEEFFVQLSESLHISFRPVMTKSCSVESCAGESPPVSDFPIEKPQSYIPKWLTLDYKKGVWRGDFGY